MFIELAVRNGCLFLFDACVIRIIYIVRVVNSLSLDISLFNSGTPKHKR